MDELEILLQSIKSVKEATTEQVQSVFDRYAKMEAQHSSKVNDKVNEVYLSQQALSTTEIKSVQLETKELQALCEERGIKYDEKYKGRVKVYRASDETVDSAGDIILQKGWDFSRFKTNPAIQYCHDYYNLPVGSGIKWQTKDNALYIHILFALPEQNEFAGTVFNMVDGGFLKGNSVGFIPKKILRIEDEKERQQLGLGKYGVIFEKQLLLEDSVCPLGCNPSALVQEAFAKSIHAGVVKLDEADRFIKSESISDDLKQAIDRAVVMVNRKIFIETETPEPSPAINYSELKSAMDSNSDTLKLISNEIQTIKTEMAELRSKVESVGTGGDQPEAETKTEKEFYDLIAGIEGVSKSFENNLNKDNK